MYSYTDPTHEQWQAALAVFPEANLLQSWQWGEVNTQLGHTIVRRLISKDGTVCAMMSCIIKDAKRGRYLEVPAGPLLNWDDVELSKAALALLKELAAKHACAFIRMRPQLPDTEKERARMQSFGLKQALMHVAADHTSIIDVTPDEEELLRAMRQQTRYEVRRGAKRGVSVQAVDPAQHIETFHALQADTAARQNFYPPSLAFLKAVSQTFGENAVLYQATKGDTLLNMALVLYFNQEVAYFEAASTPDARREPGAYAIIWKIIQDAKVRGFRLVNLWGTAPPEAKNHRYAGVTTFKRGFGGEDVAYLPAYDMVLDPLRYSLTRLIEAIRKKRRRL
ncbi:MAG TPA: peptidoglycan bridge formation glycyltransferase FemA/FemB family protein [Patescibacteria group bacterium]|jgi:lipid II:glycine glycyltransferase (peptidoglycan interpeptide bridge formation enzyme)|nr:peptidoglycan bridge formation glycyltransferase FemA/FemB family protein [Patescibacteria group bacterium]